MQLLQFTARYYDEKPGRVTEIGRREQLSRKLRSLYNWLTNEENPQLWFPANAAYAPVWPSYHTISRALREKGIYREEVRVAAPPGATRFVLLDIKPVDCF